MKLKLRTKSAADIPEVLREFYREDEAGIFHLDTEFDPARLRAEQERDRWRRVAERHLLGAAADKVVDRLGVDTAFQDLLHELVLGRLALHFDDDDDEHASPRVVVVGADGEPATLEDGRDLTLDLIGLPGTDPEFTKQYGACWGSDSAQAGPRKAAGEQSGHDDRDVVLPAGYTHAEFEAAFRETARTGGTIVFPTAREREASSSSRDVRLAPGYNQIEFEAAFHKATEQGGTVVFERDAS